MYKQKLWSGVYLTLGLQNSEAIIDQLYLSVNFFLFRHGIKVDILIHWNSELSKFILFHGFYTCVAL